MPKFFLIFLFFLCGITLSAQDNSDMKEMLKELMNSKEDSSKVLLMIQIGQEYENERPDLSKKYYRDANELSEKINYQRGILKYIANYTFLLNMEGKYDSSILLNLQAVDLAKKINDREYLGKSLINTGGAYNGKGDYENAARYYEMGKPYFENTDNPLYEGIIYDHLQMLYFKLNQYDKGIEYGKKAVSLMKQTDDENQLITAIINLGLNYNGKSDFEKAENYFNEALDRSVNSQNLMLESISLLNLINLDLSSFQLDEIPPKADRILEISDQINTGEDRIIALKALGIYHLNKGNFPESENYFNQSLQMAKELDIPVQIWKIYGDLSSLYFAKNDFKKANLFAAKSDSVQIRITNAELQKNIQELEKKYETEKKEATILVQQSKLKSRRVLNYIFGGGILVLAAILWLLYRNHSQKQKIQKQRIAELEAEQKLNAVQSVLKGEHQERARLAKDIHDSLSGMLSGIKYSLQHLKGNSNLNDENQQDLDRTMDMLDSSIHEMRRVAHNIMPEALVRYGLDAALKDYSVEINKTGMVEVIYQSMGMENRKIEQSVSIAIYRIIQELLNNVIKHSGASRVLVQLLSENSKLVVNVEDNGKGFDIDQTGNNGGMGWKNIRSRIELLNGRADIQSAPEKGASINLEFNLT
ncbi:MAG: sensor histidine kinase [Moheibacter sp.]